MSAESSTAERVLAQESDSLDSNSTYDSYNPCDLYVSSLNFLSLSFLIYKMDVELEGF